LTAKTTDCGSIARADIETMLRALSGEREHDYQGACPVPGATNSRDPDCPVCQAMMRVAAAYTECRSVQREVASRLTQLAADLENGADGDQALARNLWACVDLLATKNTEQESAGRGGKS
jgi:hypothetical protein